MNDFKIEKINSYQLFDIDTLELIGDFDVGCVTAESYVEPSSLSKEILSFNQTATFECESVDISPFFDYAYSKLSNIEYEIPIRIQACWHKKKRINKKWLKRYGMKEDVVRVKCDVDSISPDNSYDPYNLVESKGFNMELSNVQYQFRPDQLRKNMKIELVV